MLSSCISESSSLSCVAQISWDHRKCISSYRVSLCSRASSSCYEAQEVVGSNVSRVVHSITDLAPCTEYTLSIFPSTGEGELNTQPATLATKPPPARHWP